MEVRAGGYGEECSGAGGEWGGSDVLEERREGGFRKKHPLR